MCEDSKSKLNQVNENDLREKVILKKINSEAVECQKSQVLGVKILKEKKLEEPGLVGGPKFGGPTLSIDKAQGINVEEISSGERQKTQASGKKQGSNEHPS
ncbi:hypothetical protein ACFE04_029703 [Oxalis oulophora]